MNPIIIGEDAIKRVVGLPGDFVLMNTPEQSEVMVQVSWQYSPIRKCRGFDADIRYQKAIAG
jgi:signal peptidase I